MKATMKHGKVVMDKTELARGIKHETAEHPKVVKGNEATARQLVVDHLKEHPDYYKKLQTVFKK